MFKKKVKYLMCVIMYLKKSVLEKHGRLPKKCVSARI